MPNSNYDNIDFWRANVRDPFSPYPDIVPDYAKFFRDQRKRFQEKTKLAMMRGNDGKGIYMYAPDVPGYQFVPNGVVANDNAMTYPVVPVPKIGDTNTDVVHDDTTKDTEDETGDNTDSTDATANGGYGVIGQYTPLTNSQSVLGDMSTFGRNMSESAVNLGLAIGQRNAWKESGEDVSRSDRNRNRLMGIGAGMSLVGGALSAGFDLFKQGASAAATSQRNAWIDRENRKKLANARQGQVTAVANGGLIGGSGNGITPVVGPSGEFIAPKKDGGNIVAEKEEVAKIPGDDLTKEFLGERHEDGGTQTSVPKGTRILSDRRKLTDAQAQDIRERYGIKVSSKDTYSDAAKKYKDRIGLNKALDEMAVLEEKLKKNTKSVKDKNTSRLNSSIISEHMSDVQSQIDELSQKDSDFFDVLFNFQEQEKRDRLREYYFADGGKVDREEFEESRKKFGLSEEEAIEYFLDKAMSAANSNDYFLGGGEEEEVDRRFMAFVPIFNSRRTETETYGDNGYQPFINGTYGRVSEWGESAVNELGRLHPRLAKGENRIIGFDDSGKAGWSNFSNMRGNADVIEKVVNAEYEGANALSDEIPNFDKTARNFLMYDFSAPSEQGPDPKSGKSYAHNERTGEGKVGEYHMTRSAFGLRVVTPEQLKQLNDKGIKFYSDLLENPDVAKKILPKEDYERLLKLKDKTQKVGDKTLSAKGIDFMLMDYIPEMNPETKPEERQNMELLESPKTPGAPGKPDIEIDLNPIIPKKIPKRKYSKEKIGRTSEGIPNLFAPMGWGSAGMQPSPMDPNYLNQVRYMRAEPVLRTADEVVSGINAGTNAQIRSLNDVADPQRFAALASIGAKRDEAIDRAISEIDYFNAQQRNRADELNENRYMQTDQMNAALRDQYEQRVLQDKAANEDAWFRYFQNIRDRQLAEDEVRIKAQILSNIYPNVDIQGNFRNGQPLTVSKKKQIDAINKQNEEDNKSKSSKSTKKKVD